MIVIKVRTGCICYITKHLRAGHHITCKLYSRNPSAMKLKYSFQRHMSASKSPSPASFPFRCSPEVVVNFRPPWAAHRPQDSVIFLWPVEHSSTSLTRVLAKTEGRATHPPALFTQLYSRSPQSRFTLCHEPVGAGWNKLRRRPCRTRRGRASPRCGSSGAGRS